MKFLIVSVLWLAFYPATTAVRGESAAAEKATPQDPDRPRVIVKGEVMKKMLVHKVPPSYPEEARHPPVAGTVRLHVVIGVDGSVKQVEFISGPSVFAQSSMDAVRQWKYKPPTVKGQPVEVDTTVEIVFSFIQ